MRDIKFRVWNSFLRKMNEWGSVKKKFNLNIFESDLDEYHVMQYAGLKDKNGKEIYEGDIVGYNATRRQGFQVEKYQHSKPVVLGKFNPQASDLSDYIGFHINESSIEYILSYDNAEVIGNIYENPELLETK